MRRLDAVAHRELESRDVLEELVALVDDLHADAVAVRGQHPRQPQAERHRAGGLDGTERVEGKQRGRHGHESALSALGDWLAIGPSPPTAVTGESATAVQTWPGSHCRWPS